MNKNQIFLFLSSFVLVMSSCQNIGGLGGSNPLAKVESVRLFSYFENGRPRAYGEVRGLKNPRTRISDKPRQERRAYRIFVEIDEIGMDKNQMQTQELVPYTHRFDIDTRGMDAQVYIVNVNGVEEHLEVMGSGGRMGNRDSNSGRGGRGSNLDNWGNAVPKLPKDIGQKVGKFFDKYMR